MITIAFLERFYVSNTTDTSDGRFNGCLQSIFYSLEICFKYPIKRWQMLIEFYLSDVSKKGFELNFS